MKQILLISTLIVFGAQLMSAQMFNMSNGSVSTCTGQFVDDGGIGPYSATDYVFTICPDTPGDVIQVEFVAFQLQTGVNFNASDWFTIYDGDDTSAPELGTYIGNDLQGLPVTATINNTSGCLTFAFQDNGADNTTMPGWEGLISCTTPCDSPVASSVISDPEPDGAIQTVSVCQGTAITFEDNGSYAGTGFTIDEYVWNFDDGTIDNTSGESVVHAFNEPGEYIVTLTVVDNNGCNSLNLDPLQVLVSTIPLFPGMMDQTICLGAEAELVGNAESVTWTALPPQVVSGATYLADGAGFSYSTSLNFDFFEPGATLDDCDDLLGVFVNMEHSYMGDLGILITCPDGTSVSLVEWGVNGGGGTFLGEAIDDESTDMGVGYDYVWDPDATNGTWGENATGFGGSLAAGSYEAYGDLCDLVGCPLNGEWTFTVTDNLAIDNGYIFYWGIDLNPELFPGVTTFTPQIGADADSSYWSGPFITDVSPDGDVITILPDEEGVFCYDYIVTNNFSCTFDTTICVTVQLAPQVYAGSDIYMSCDNTMLQGGLDGSASPSCGDAAGTFTYCYTDNENFVWTFCPDTPGDGISFMTFTFDEASAEACCDFITVYDGPDTSSPVMASGVTGEMSGMSWTATNSDGCITIAFDSDFSVNCASYGEWTYTVACDVGGPQFVWEWSPPDGLSATDIPNPTVSGINEDTEYTLVGYPVGFPGCASSDEVTVVVGDDLPDPGEDGVAYFCATGAGDDLFNYLGGTPDAGGEWTTPLGVVFDGIIEPSTDQSGVYTYTVGGPACPISAQIDVTIGEPVISVNDVTICLGGTATLTAFGVGGVDDSDWIFDWVGLGTGNDLQVTPDVPTTYTVSATTPEGCESDPVDLEVDIFDPITIVMGDDQSICGGGTAVLEVETTTGGMGAPYTYTWTFNGSGIGSGEQLSYVAEDSGDYCVSVTDGCETPAAIDCIYVTVEEEVEVTFAADTTEGCFPATIVFTNTIDPALYNSAAWEFGDGATALNEVETQHTYADPGSYDVTLTIVSPAGCIYGLVSPGFITVHNHPEAAWSAEPQPTVIPETEITFENLSLGSVVESYWEFGYPEPIGTSTDMNPVYEFPQDAGGVYPIYLLVTDEHNCTDEVIGVVVINNLFQVYIPNSFTPNGDNINDVWMVHGSDLDPENFLIQVFNRWGDVVFESTDPGQAWTGENDLGEYFVPDGVYIWRCEISSLSTTEKKELTGTVTLFR
ncbi:MAG: gliding motility-associated C-terminal domain-containing protein [Flavobacteriales bacterium]|nr:gliding motility-associated C-terminal domain-containing protein [Flavobacteriales bacterium]